MVSHLRFPPGMAGGLLLAYPRMMPDHSGCRSLTGVMMACRSA